MTKMHDKIRALIAKAESTSNENEAAVFIAKAEELMVKYQIEAFELGDSSDPVGMTQGVHGQSGPTAYKTHLQSALAQYYGCRAIRNYTCQKKWQVELVGAESARVTTEIMTDFVWKQCNAEARKIAKAEGGKPGPIQRRIVNALVHRILTEVAEREATPPKNKIAAQNALVIKSAVDAWIEEHYSDLTRSRGGRRSTNASAKAAAQKISLHRQTGGAKVKQIS